MKGRDIKFRLGTAIALKAAESIDKEHFLRELKIKWDEELPAEFDVDTEVESSWNRIKNFGNLSNIFNKVKLTKEDFKQVLEEIKCSRSQESQ